MRRSKTWLAAKFLEHITFNFDGEIVTKQLQYNREKNVYFFQVGYKYVNAEECDILQPH